MKFFSGKKNTFFTKNSNVEVEPDEIFIDSSNLPEFDTYQLEGHLEKPIPKKIIKLTGFIFLIIGLVFMYKSLDLQIIHGSKYKELSMQNHLDYQPVFAERGAVIDKNEERLIWNYPNPKSKADFSIRKYTDKPGIAHLLGYVKYPAKDKKGNYYRKNFKGQEGIEKSLENKLNGENGLKIVEKNALSEIQSEAVLHPQKDGELIKLSIDSKLQSNFFKFIKKTAKQSKFKAGAGVIMNTRNGNILALTNYPEYDPEILSKGELTDVISSYQKSDRNIFMNRAISGLYTPGSIVKPFMAIAALEEDIITPQKKILSTGSISIPNPYYPEKETIFNDWKAHGWVDMQEAIAVSSNVYFYEIGGGYKDQKGLGIENIENYMKIMGFGEKTGIKLNSEKEGLIPTPEWKENTFENGDWRLGDTYNTSIGQYGFQVTPLQMARNTAFIANGGTLLTPSLIEGKKRKSKEIESFSKEHFNIVKEGMRKAVEMGSAKGLNVGYIEVAAKTGTAELSPNDKEVNSWVIGFWPYENPHYSFAVVMEEGEYINHIGGVYVMRQLLDWMHSNTPEYFEF